MWEYGSAEGGSILPGNKDFISPTLAIRDGDWKLLINADSTDMQLYNLKTDPGEQRDVAGENEVVAKRLAEEVINWRRTMPVAIRE